MSKEIERGTRVRMKAFPDVVFEIGCQRPSERGNYILIDVAQGGWKADPNDVNYWVCGKPESFNVVDEADQ